ncbi:MAG: dynamin family protein [Pseudomonadota bacterium]
MKSKTISKYLLNLEKHLADENPILLEAAKAFHELDQIAYDLGLIDMDESTACRISWWPLITILGTFSAGKSTFINQFLGVKVQLTGSQAVDDKFTVLHYTHDKETTTLPGIALDADPRFPFYQISQEIEQAAAGEGHRINAYLQLKTCPSQRLKGKILIDSPGFDADSQRTATLRITKHIIDLADLVLIFFDARRPEVGAMRDTLKHLVKETIHRHDSNKFMFILNQMDATAREDNPEDVVSAWQRALAEHGLTAGRFFTIYSKDASVPISDQNMREHFEKKRDRDLKVIETRIESVSIERAYRILGSLENTAREIDKVAMPEVWEAIKLWKKRVHTTDVIILLLLVAGIVFIGLQTAVLPLLAQPVVAGIAGIALVAIMGAIHMYVSRFFAAGIIKRLTQRRKELNLMENLAMAFEKNATFWRTLLPITRPSGWSNRTHKEILTILEQSKEMVQSLNNAFSNPSGTTIDSAEEKPKPQA